MNAAAELEPDGFHQAINFYIGMLRKGSVETLKQAFQTQATMCGYLGKTLMIKPIQGLYDLVASHDAPAITGEPFSAPIWLAIYCKIRILFMLYK